MSKHTAITVASANLWESQPKIIIFEHPVHKKRIGYGDFPHFQGITRKNIIDAGMKCLELLIAQNSFHWLESEIVIVFKNGKKSNVLTDSTVFISFNLSLYRFHILLLKQVICHEESTACSLV